MEDLKAKSEEKEGQAPNSKVA